LRVLISLQALPTPATPNKLDALFPLVNDKPYQRPSDRETSPTESDKLSYVPTKHPPRVSSNRSGSNSPSSVIPYIVFSIACKFVLNSLGCFYRIRKYDKPKKEHCGPNEANPTKARSFPIESSSAATSLQEKHVTHEGSFRGRKTLSSCSHPHSHNGAWYLNGVSLDRGGVDPEIEITLCRLRKVWNTIVSNTSSSNFDNIVSITNDSDFLKCSSSNINSNCNFGLSNFQELEPMENNDQTLKELATPDVVKTPTSIEKNFSGLFHNEATGDTKRLHQDEGVPILPGWSCKRLTVFATSSFQHQGRYEAHVPREVLPGVQNYDHQKENLLDKATLWRDSTRVLGKI
ncbi:hypothetical protein CR513_25367, partial [Mucuna pruriens]